MNSSGIKRGLATTAISALAVTGLPALASTANAAPGDEIQFVSAGPTLNHGSVGGEIHVKLKGITEAELDSDLTVFNTALTDDSADSATQSVAITDASYEYIASGAAGDSNPTDGYAEAVILVAVDTPVDGNTANYALVVDDNNDGVAAATEARTQVAQQTSGALSKLEVAPATQTSPQNVESGAYTVTLKDSAGRTTQLDTTEVINLTPSAGTVTLSDNQFDEFEVVDGSQSFTATGTAVGTFTIAIDSPDYTGEQTSAEFKVTEAANLGASEINIVTAADTWSDFGDDDAGTTYVRVDQNTIRFDFNSDPNQPGANVQLTVDGTDMGPGNGVTFEGQAVRTYTTTLDSAGNGSITVTADAATVQEGDQVAVDINGFSQTIEFARAAFDSIESESDVYFCQDDASCTVTAIVKDQFGNPITTGEVEARRTGPQNIDAAPQRKAVGPDGRVSFTFADANPVDGGTDTVNFNYFVDQFDNTAENPAPATATIEYSATGQGSDYVVSLDGANTEAANYDSSAAGDSAVVPLSDTQANDDDEASDITIAGGEPNQAVTLSVDNGALILAPGEQYLSEGSASVETTTDGGGALAGYRIIGTKSGLVTLTVTSAQRTETAQFTVKAQDDVNSARNVTVSGPAEVEHGTNQITFTAVVTDAFGNPVAGVSTTLLNKQVSGPAFYQDGDTQSDANGLIRMNVRVDSDAEGDVTLTVDAADGTYQFGAAENRLTTADTTGNPGEGLSASSDIASATTTVKAGKVPAALTLKGGDNGAADDSLFANAINKTEGATVKLFRKRADGTWKQIRTGVMNALGNFRFKDVNDLNGNGRTRYKAVVEATAETLKGIGKKTVR